MRTAVQGFTIFALAALICSGVLTVSLSADPSSEKKIMDVRDMTVRERADLGELLIFGMEGGSEIRGAIGRAQCPLCHGFEKGFPSERAPNLWGIPYKKRNKATPLEYLAESHICPSCYIVGGYSHGTVGSESSMPAIHKPPISLSIDELIAIDTWLYYREGLVPPSPQEIEQAYRKFIPKSEWPYPSSDPEIYPGRFSRPTRSVVTTSLASKLTGKEPIEEIFTTAACIGCHTIPGIQRPADKFPPMEQLRRTGVVPGGTSIVGPPLTMKTTAPERIRSKDYKGKATNVREYIIESIVDPSIYVVKGYGDHMPKGYGEELAGPVIERMADYLSQLEEEKQPPKAR